MRKANRNSTLCGGVDTAKATLTFAVEGCDETQTCANSPEGRKSMIDVFGRHGVRRVGIESTGVYHLAATEDLRAAGFEVVVFQPAQVKAYARFRLVRAKSDPLDARLIARCTADAAGVRQPPDPRLAAFCEHLTLIEQIEEDIARLKTRRERFTHPRHLAMLETEIKAKAALKRAEIKLLVAALREHADLSRRLDLLESIEGIGLRTALTLALRMPELGTLSREEAASLLGVAPFVQESGAFKGQRRTSGGRARARTALFAAAQVACQRWNPALKALYARLIAAGKPYALAVVACTRKLIVYANTVIARDRPWQKTTAQ